ncbi:MAG: ATP-binding cassette domain-containing protein [Anaeroplasma sp.]
MSIIKMSNVSKYYNNNGNISIALKNINLEFNKGEIVAIVGDSGSGKSTLLNVITAVDTYEDGEIYYYDEETSYFNQNDMDVFRKNKVGFIFQNYNIIESYTVLQNVMIPLIINGMPKKEAKAKAIDILGKVGLDNRLKNKGSKLSGGEKQRCVIARALASDCEILACDEPTGNLDSQTGKEIIDLIREIAADKLVLIVTHNYNQVKDIVTRKIVIHDGIITEDTRLKEISNVVEDKKEIIDNNISLKDLFKISVQNILGTPKKTIFISTVFLTISSIIILLILSLFQLSYNNSLYSTNVYVCNDERHLIAYNKDNTQISKDILNGIDGYYITNPFFENVEYSLFLSSPSVMVGYSGTACYCPFNVAQKHLYGNVPQKSGEYYIITPSNTSGYQIHSYVGGSILFNGKRGLLVGTGESDNILAPIVYSYDDYTEYFRNSIIKSNTTAVYKNSSTYYINYLKIIGGEKTILYLPYEHQYYKNKQLDIIISSMYKINLDYEIVYQNNNTFELAISADDWEKIYNTPFEVSIYTNNKDKTIKYLKDNSVEFTDPMHMFKIDKLAVTLTFYFSIIITAITILVLVVLTYAILYKVYSSKNKDYTVLRSLGILRNKMKIIVRFESVIQCLFSSGIALLIIVAIYYLTDKRFLKMVSFISPQLIIILFAVMTFFSLLLASRFNKKLFKFSVNSSFKGDVISND